MTRKELRRQLADNIKSSADFGDNGAIQCEVSLIRDYIAKGDMNSVEERLKSIEECCMLNACRNMQNYHAFTMMYNLALLIGEKYDPMY